MSKVDKQKFEEIIEQVKTHGVSANDVISFENMIGSSFITDNYKLNRFTSSRSNVNAENVIYRAIENMNKIEREATKYTILDVCKLSEEVYYKCKSLVKSISSISEAMAKPENSEKIDRLLNEKWCLKWHDDSVLNLSKDYGMVEAFRFNRSYIQGVSENKNIVDGVVNDIERYVQETEDGPGEYSPLLVAIYNDSFAYLYSKENRAAYKEFFASTYNCLILITNFDKDHSESLIYTTNTIKNILDDYRTKSRMFSIYDYEEVTTTYNNLKNLEALLDDKLAKLILETFSNLFRN